MKGNLGRVAAGLPLTALLLGGTMAVAGLAMIICGLVGLFGDGRAVAALIVPGAAIAPAGAVLVRYGRSAFKGSLTFLPIHGFTAVTLAYLGAAMLGTIPFLAASVFTSPADGLFESMSGFTTTGATLIADIEAQPEAILAWRSVSQWLGGIGIVVLVVAVAPISGPGIQRAFYAEFSGVAADRLTPRISDTAKIVAGIYLALTAAAAVTYFAVGMGGFDAVNHAMTTLATGGFSTRNESIEAFHSLPIEIAAISFMIVAGVNFAFYWRAIRGGSIMPQGAEVRAYLIIITAAITIVTISLVLSGDVDSTAEGLRDAAFDVTSITTGTGYVTADFDNWNQLARVGMLMLMFIGGCAGSTSGGIKVSRVVLLVKSARQELDRQLRPTAIQVLRMGGRSFSEDVRRAVLGFFLIYILLYAFGILAFAASGLELASSLGAATASLNIIGPGIGDVGATDDFRSVHPGGRGVATFLMLAGRLEVFTVVALLAAILSTRGARR